MLQLSVHMPQLKILHASTKIEDLAQPNKYIYIFKKNEHPREHCEGHAAH